jgi:hypothetical protein
MSMTDALEQIKKTATPTPNINPLDPQQKRTRRTREQILNDTKKAQGIKIPIPMNEGDPAIAEILKIPFDVWANSQELPALKLQKDEALNLSKPVKALLDHYMPQVSPIGYVWVSFALIITNTLTSRMLIISNERKNRKKDNNDHRTEGKRKIDASKADTSEQTTPNNI